MFPRGQIEFTKTVQMLSKSNLTVMTVVQDTLRARGPLGLYKGLPRPS